MDGASTHLLCPSCDHEPPSSSAIGDACPACGAKLVYVKREGDLIGTTVDRRFEVRSVLGAGGMGTVYRAWQQSIGREIAIKVLDRSFSHDVGMTKRFLREARLASQLVASEHGRRHRFRPGRGRAAVHRDGAAARRDARARAGRQWRARRSSASRGSASSCSTRSTPRTRCRSSIAISSSRTSCVLDDARGDHIKVLDFGLAKSLDRARSRATRRPARSWARRTTWRPRR